LLLDSNIIIYANSPGYDFLTPWVCQPSASVSAISIPEVLGFPGLASEDERRLTLWFDRMAIHPIDDGILYRAAEIRRAQRCKLGDAIIAATALTHGLRLVTRNTKDFRYIPDIEVIDPFVEPLAT
jgi:predicted nucleic acid-binding protein